MGLVNYSESESSGSESEAAPKKAPPQKAPGTKKPFQKVVDRSNPGKIVVNLPQAASSSNHNAGADEAQSSDGPPAKRARTSGAGGGRFSGFNSFLPAPKNARNAAVSKPATSASSTPGQSRPVVTLKTSAEPGFSREIEESRTDGNTADGIETPAAAGGSLPPPKRPAEPSIPQGQKPADEVKLVGKPLMFKPLSVSRKPNKKKTVAVAAPAASTLPTSDDAERPQPNGSAGSQVAPASAPQKVSLFSLHAEEPVFSTDAPKSSGAYEPLFATPETSNEDYYAQFAGDAYAGPSATTAPHASSTAGQSLDSIADDLNLSAAARRELFGRGLAAAQTATSVKNFNMDDEYRHNEELRAAGEQQTHNPVRSIQGGGKHSLRQLVQNVHNQREALEDSFARGKSNRKEASSKYGW
ncbi:hypothetical protein JDV02_007487 [Purpureocillium takamizusanense]|uniref:Stress activated map kinase interacting n=1 Tax=Purpureocillium takamizusanense TaxID=2060973 RepID=A0A9Q8QKN1_9HYPO|nr:uncharacterized protein JDV02_007487 [Purpureocillium takamizusanense]UNI21503.1 hypothetical protein JDV02_007487 [Purpureocillium takamizusanense]